MNEEKLREAFQKIREDMNYFHSEIEKMKASLEEIKLLKRTLEELNITTQELKNQTTQQRNPTLQHKEEASKSPISAISSGNEGVPTNKPTNQQTIQHPIISSPKFALNNTSDKISKLEQAAEIIESLDELRKEVRIKFKQLTTQEMRIFSTIYTLQDRGILPDYQLLAEHLNLSEISIRDYIRKIIKKGIPLEKHKSDDQNSKIMLKIPDDLRKIASLQTIQQLRSL